MPDLPPDKPPVVDADVTPARIDPAGGPSVPEPLADAIAAAATGSAKSRAIALETMAHAATLPQAEDVELGQPHCQRCEVLPRRVAGPGTVHLNLPHTHTLGKVLLWLVRGNWPHARRNGVVSVQVPTGSLAPLVTPLMDLLSPTERQDTRAFFQPAGDSVQLIDYFSIDRLDVFAAKAGSDWLVDMMREARLDTHFQPILTADGRTVYGHECLLRGCADGRTVAPGLMFDVARRADLVFQLDMAARRTALHAAARHDVAGKVFVNFSPSSIYDAEHCLDSTVRLADELGLNPGRLVFEMVETERLPDLDHLKAITAYYRRNGFEVAVDDLGAGYASLQLLLGLRPDYVKLDMSLTRGVDADPGKAVLAGKLLEAARDLGLRTIAEGIETEGEWGWVRDHGADFVQGYLFARPASPPATPWVPAARA